MNSRPLRLTTTIVPTVLVTVLGIAAYYGSARERGAAALVDGSHRTVAAYQTILADVREAQNSMRGYVVSGQEFFLRPYEVASASIARDRAVLKEALGDDAAGNADYRRIEDLTTRAFTRYQAVIGSRRDQGPTGAMAEIASGRGEIITQELRDVISHALGREQYKLAEAQRSRVRHAHFIELLVPLGALAAAILAFLLNNSLARYAKREEMQVQQLSEANEQLMDQQAELEASNVELEEAGLELQHNEQRWRELIEHSSDVVAVIDAEGRTSYISPSVERVLGYTVDEILHQNTLVYVHPDDAQKAADLRSAAQNSPDQPMTATVRVRAKDASYRTFSYTMVNLIEHPAVRGMVVNARDVTEAARLEEQLLHAQKMDAVGRLAGGIAHDFNNLLTAMKGYLALVMERVSDSEAVADLKEVDLATDRASALTRQLLAFSRQQVLSPRTVDVNDVVEDYVRMMGRIIGEQYELRSRLFSDPLYTVVDAAQLHQVLMNLVVNARDAMADGGMITVEVRKELRDAPWPGESAIEARGYAMIAVSDTGIGMPPEVRAKIFEPFFTTKATGKGTGLGLSTAYGIIKQSGGHIYVYSELGHGTTFKVYLPLSAESAMHDMDDGGHDGSGTEKVVLAEDDHSVRALAARALRGKGYQVLEAQNGREALALLSANPDTRLVISDVIMPDMRGHDLVTEVQREYPGMHVILMSGYSETDPTRLPNGTSFIEKPFTIAALTRRVREIIDGVVA